MGKSRFRQDGKICRYPVSSKIRWARTKGYPILQAPDWMGRDCGPFPSRPAVPWLPLFLLALFQVLCLTNFLLCMSPRDQRKSRCLMNNPVFSVRYTQTADSWPKIRLPSFFWVSNILSISWPQFLIHVDILQYTPVILDGYFWGMFLLKKISCVLHR